MKSHMNFSSDEIQADRMLQRVINSHLDGCIFKINEEDLNKDKLKVLSLPQNEFSSSNLNQNIEFLILNRRLMQLRWQEIYVSLLRSFKDETLCPVISKEFIKVFEQESVQYLKKLVWAVNTSISTDLENQNKDNSINLYGLFSLFGWRSVRTTDKHYLECCFCARSIEFGILKLQKSKYVLIEIKQNEDNDQNDLVPENAELFEFDPLNAHHKFCYNHPYSKPNKQKAYQFLVQMLLIKYSKDPQLLYIRNQVLNDDNQHIESKVFDSSKLQGLSEFVQDQIIQKIKDKQEIQSIISNYQQKQEEQNQIAQQDSQLGKRILREDADGKDVISQVKQSLEENRKRLKYFQEQTLKLRELVKK
ncbi:UNKNOWN [Stylonychia lemnae]|uniref:NuBaID C-terminal domain-containing protein n=1 Tax=Stylonychia lemnae TaxID=5949 RepID=A0A078AKR9_STYLE|nr:UNKNOWN [Stylonychia lemnae]|eukprot:CDW82047.1 UNKNOWN [Stylonychia lemnae]